jgi:hypothetical protein
MVGGRPGNAGEEATMIKRYAVQLIGLAALVLAVGIFAGWLVGKESRPEAPVKLERIEARQRDADATAGSLVDALGRLCGNFDFYFKHDMARGAFRPVRCSLSGRDETGLIAYGFDTSRTQDAWVSEWGGLADQRGATLIEDGIWATEVMDPSIVEEVRSVVLGSP